MISYWTFGIVVLVLLGLLVWTFSALHEAERNLSTLRKTIGQLKRRLYFRDES